jgi:hypothetical protein
MTGEDWSLVREGQSSRWSPMTLASTSGSCEASAWPSQHVSLWACGGWQDPTEGGQNRTHSPDRSPPQTFQCGGRCRGHSLKVGTAATVMCEHLPHPIWMPAPRLKISRLSTEWSLRPLPCRGLARCHSQKSSVEGLYDKRKQALRAVLSMEAFESTGSPSLEQSLLCQ